MSRASTTRAFQPNLGDDVERLIDDAVKKRPDIAAQIAAVRAGDAGDRSGQSRSSIPKSK